MYKTENIIASTLKARPIFYVSDEFTIVSSIHIDIISLAGAALSQVSTSTVLALTMNRKVLFIVNGTSIDYLLL